MNTPKEDKTIVSIVVAGSGADQLIQKLIKDSAEAAPLIKKGKKRSEIESRTIAKVNLKRKQDLQTLREQEREIVLKLYKLRPELKRASRENLACEVQSVLARRGITRSTKSIIRGFPPKK